MSAEIKDGGPAAPTLHFLPPLEDGGQPRMAAVPGMSLRDWFAGQALAGICGHMVGCNPRAGETAAQADARFAYARADAMLKAREAQS